MPNASFDPLHPSSVFVSGGASSDRLSSFSAPTRACPPQLRTNIAEFEEAIARATRPLVDREGIVEQAKYALLTGEHLLIVGDKGTGKSLTAGVILSAIRDAIPPYINQLTHETTEAQLLAGLDFREFMRGLYHYNTDERLVKAHFAILEEFFDATDYTLRSLNGLLADKRFTKGTQVIDADLHTVIATSNFNRINQATRAVLDRFLFKAEARPIEGALSRFQLQKRFLEFRGRPVAIPDSERLPYEKLKLLSSVATGESSEHRVHYPMHIVFLLNQILEDYEGGSSSQSGETTKTEPLSDRARNKILNVLAASALRRGSMIVEDSDFASLCYVVPMVGDRLSEENFSASMSSTLQSFTAGTRNTIDRVLATAEFFNEMAAQGSAIETRAPHFLDRVKQLLALWTNIPTPPNLTLEQILKRCELLDSTNTHVKALKAQVIEHAREQTARAGIPMDFIVIHNADH